MKHKKRPFHEDYNMCKITIDNASSVTDCTGLEPRPPLNEAEQDSYACLYNFFPEDIAENKEKDAE